MIKDTQFENIRLLRAKNLSYAKIAEILGISANTVKSVCRRRGYAAENTGNDDVSINLPLQEELIKCRYCGKLVDNPWHRHKKLFCSDQCRFAYWNHEKKLNNYISPKRRKDLSEKAMDFLPQKRD